MPFLRRLFRFHVFLCFFVELNSRTAVYDKVGTDNPKSKTLRAHKRDTNVQVIMLTILLIFMCLDYLNKEDFEEDLDDEECAALLSSTHSKYSP